MPAGQVAQLVEHGTENPGVGGSIPSPGTFSIKEVIIHRSEGNLRSVSIPILSSLDFLWFFPNFQTLREVPDAAPFVGSPDVDV